MSKKDHLFYDRPDMMVVVLVQETNILSGNIEEPDDPGEEIDI